MVVDIVDIERIAFGKAEDHSSVSPYGDRPKSPQLTLQGMEPETGQVHVRHDI